MSLSLGQSKTALAVNLTASFLATGGTAPYVYSVRANGAGGTIDSGTGVYTAPGVVSDDPALLYDTIQVRDNVGALATAQILVGTPFLLFCEIIQRQLALPQGRVFMWNQKLFQPTDAGLYVAISVPRCKPFSNNIGPADADWSSSAQWTNFMATLDLNIMSRDTSAFNQKELVIMSLNSLYAQAQQEANSFLIGKIPPNSSFQNLALVDGAAIPYRYQISVNMQYVATLTQAVPYYDTFQPIPVTTNP